MRKGKYYSLVPSPSSSLPRLVGYALVAGVLAAGGLFAAFAIREFRNPGVTVRVGFAEISTLSPGDPVVENGVEIGRVADIVAGDAADGMGSGAVAILKLDRRALPPRDTRFVNFSHSLMGARKVWMRPGDSPLPLDTARVQEGVFIPGLPETLRKARNLNARIAAWRAASEDMLGGGDSAAALRALGALERAFARLAAMNASLEGAARDLSGGVSGLTAIEGKASEAARAADPKVAAAGRRVAMARADLTRLEADVSASLSRLETLAATLQSDTGVAGRLLADRALYDSLTRGVETLTRLSRALEDEGLGDSAKIRPRLRGAARE
jgi:hypothetical protein